MRKKEHSLRLTSKQKEAELIVIEGPKHMYGKLIAFDDDPKSAMCNFFHSEGGKRGVYMHPWHNMFISGAHTAEIIDETLTRTEGAFVALKKKFG